MQTEIEAAGARALFKQRLLRMVAVSGMCLGSLGTHAIRALGGEDLKRGRQLFSKEWLPAGPRRALTAGDGLGPLYDETSCLACHYQGGAGGSGPRSANVQILTAEKVAMGANALLLRQSSSLFSGGLILHRFGVDPDYKSWRLRLLGDENSADKVRMIESTIVQRQVTYEARTVQAGAGRLRWGIFLSERNPPALFGLGLIDAIPDDVLLAAEERRFPLFPEIRGHARRLRGGGLGRFGWRAEVQTLRDFVRLACANELGLEVPGHHQPESPLAPGSKPAALDMTEDECNALESYVRRLSPATATCDDARADQPEAPTGRPLFEAIGCAACHVPQLGGVPGVYSDLLLHDLGPTLADSASYYRPVGFSASPGQAGAREWRTPPLWGYAGSGPYLHDGRARNLEEAVAFHSGEALATAMRFFELAPIERLRIQAFLRSLRPPSNLPPASAEVKAQGR
jgi:CxxC motif-containing protein (DUF1111 family)